MKPFIKSAGGKRKLVNEIRQLIPVTYGRYHEPFLGGGALFFDMLPDGSILCDVNKNLVNSYTCVRNNVTQVIKRLKEFSNDEECYYRIRAKNFVNNDIFQSAAEYIYCNRVCFNGLHRENRSGQFNVPFGKYTNPTICDVDHLNEVSLALKKVYGIFPFRFEESAKLVKAGDVWYADPPYVPLSETSSFVEYTSSGFGLADQIRLRDTAVALREKGAHVILSNSSAKTVYELYKPYGFKIKEVKMARSVNADGDGRGKVTELLIY